MWRTCNCVKRLHEDHNYKTLGLIMQSLMNYYHKEAASNNEYRWGTETSVHYSFMWLEFRQYATLVVEIILWIVYMIKIFEHKHQIHFHHSLIAVARLITKYYHSRQIQIFTYTIFWGCDFDIRTMTDLNDGLLTFLFQGCNWVLTALF